MPCDYSALSLRVLVCDDTLAYTELLADSLKRHGGLQVFTSVFGSAELVDSFESYGADVLLLGSNLDDQPGRGFDVLRSLRSSHGDLRAVLLVGSSKPELILEAFRAGARGVFSKEESVALLRRCVQKVHEGQVWANTEQLLTLLKAWATSHKIRTVNSRGIELLSKREKEVVSAVAQGLSNRAIAEQLDISTHTVKNCLFRIFDKLGVSSRVELLFLSLSQDTGAEGALRYLLETGLDSWLQDKATLCAVQRAAEDGALVGQLALAQLYSSDKNSPDAAKQAYKWYSILKERVSCLCDEAAKHLNENQL